MSAQRKYMQVQYSPSRSYVSVTQIEHIFGSWNIPEGTLSDQLLQKAMINPIGFL